MIVRVFVPVATAIILNLCLLSIYKRKLVALLKNIYKDYIILRLPTLYFWVGCICNIFCFSIMFIMFFSPNGTEAKWVWIVFIVFSMSSFYLMLKTIVWRLEVFTKKDYFIYHSFKGIKKICYSDCIYYKLNKNKLVLKTNTGIIIVDPLSLNFEFFIQMLEYHNITRCVWRLWTGMEKYQ